MKEFLKNKDVIIIASTNYYTKSKSKLNSHIIADQLAQKGTKVLFVESLGLKDIQIYGASDIIKTFERLKNSIFQLFYGPRQPIKNLYLLSFLKIPFDRFEIVNRLNRKLITFVLKRYSKKYLDSKPIFWNFLPNFWYLPQSIPNSGVIYHNVDDYSAIPNVDVGYVVRNERKMLKVSDIVFTVSSKRALEFKEYAKGDVIFLNNVGNFELFNKALTEKFEAPKGIKKILELNKPIVGFVGNLAAYKEDITLLTKIAKEGKDYSFIIIGSVGDGEFLTNVIELRSLHNVFFLGTKEYEELYKYLKSFDIAVIPRRKNAAGEGGFPMKYFEFLAAGLPTVVTGVGNLKQFTKLSDLGGVANTPSEFIKRFKYWVELKHNNPKEYKKTISTRLKLAKLNSWSKRIEYLNSAVSKIIRD